MTHYLKFFLLVSIFVQALAEEPFYVVEDVKKFETIRLFPDIKMVTRGFSGEVFEDIRKNDYINLVPLSLVSRYSGNISLDTDFQNSNKLKFSLRTKVSLTEALTEQDICAIPNFKLRFSACLRYKVCKPTNNLDCKKQYVVVYQKRSDLLVHAGKYALTVAVKGGETYEVGFKNTKFKKILDEKHQVKSVASSYNATHAFLILEDGQAIGRGLNNHSQVTFKGKPFGNGLFNYPHPTLQIMYGVRRRSCNNGRPTPTSWRTFNTFSLDGARGQVFSNGTIAVDQNGIAYSWGRVLGRGYKFGFRYVYSNNRDPQIRCPRRIGLLETAALKQVEMGQRHGLGLSATGQLYSWGNDRYAMGKGRLTHRTKLPGKIPINDTFIDIAAGKGFSVALNKDGVVKTFGRSSEGALGRTDNSQFGTVTFVDNQGTPKDPSDDYRANKIIKISSNINNVMAIDDKGFVWIWGTEYLGTTTKIHQTPVRVKDKNGNYIQASSIDDDVYAGPNYQIIEVRGRLYGWGHNKPYAVLSDMVPPTGSDFPVVIF